MSERSYYNNYGYLGNGCQRVLLSTCNCAKTKINLVAAVCVYCTIKLTVSLGARLE